METPQFNSLVDFHDVFDFYPTDCELRCRYTLSEDVSYAHGDRIGLFRVGWKHVTDHIMTKLAPIPLSEKEKDSALCISFQPNDLPKDENELYQLCYITHDNKVIGFSIPFAFRRPEDLVDVEDKNDPGLTVYKSRIAVLHDKIARVEEDKETAELKCHMYCERVTVLEKELSCVTTVNEELVQSVETDKQQIGQLTDKLTMTVEQMENLQSELNELKLKYGNLNVELALVNDEKNHILVELNTSKQGCVQSNLILKEMTDYNLQLKNEVDTLKQRNEILMDDKKTHQGELAQLRSDYHKLNEKTEKLTELQNTLNEQMAYATSGCARPPITDTDTACRKEMPGKDKSDADLDSQLNRALRLLDEAFESQPTIVKTQATIISELEESVKERLEKEKTFEVRIFELCDIVKHKEEEIRQHVAAKSAIEANLRDAHAKLDHCKTEGARYVEENRVLNERMGRCQMHRDTAESKVEELEMLVNGLKDALIHEPCFEAFCNILMESCRVTAMHSYRDMFRSLQFLDFGQMDIGARVRHMLDEFGVLVQDLERCRQEVKNKTDESEAAKAEARRVAAENESLNKRIREATEHMNKLNSSCLQVAKQGIDETQHIEQLKGEIVELKAKCNNFEQQLKEAKVANALTNIGQTNVGQASLVAEINHLRAQLEKWQTRNSQPKDCCADMQDRLKQSAKEYARLYNQLMSERAMKAVEASAYRQKRTVEKAARQPEAGGSLVQPQPSTSQSSSSSSSQNVPACS